MATNNNIPIVPSTTPLPDPPQEVNDVVRWAFDMSLSVKRVYGTLASIAQAAYMGGIFSWFPHVIYTESMLIPDGMGAYVPDHLEIASGAVLEIGANATLEVG